MLHVEEVIKRFNRKKITSNDSNDEPIPVYARAGDEKDHCC